MRRWPARCAASRWSAGSTGGTARCWRSAAAARCMRRGLADHVRDCRGRRARRFERLLRAGLPHRRFQLHPAADRARCRSTASTLAPRVGADRTLMRGRSAPLIANGVADARDPGRTVALMRYAAQSDATPVPFALPLDPAGCKQDFRRGIASSTATRPDEPCVIEVGAGAGAPAVHDRCRRGRRPRRGRCRTEKRICSSTACTRLETAIMDRAGAD